MNRPLLFASLLFLAPALAVAAPLERQPYLQSAGPNAVTVVWTTTVDSGGSVEYGPQPDQLTQSVDSTVNDTQHEVRLTGLQANTRYYYQVTSDGTVEAGGDEQHFFVTSPPAGSPAKLRAWIVGDSGTGGSMQANVRDAMLNVTGATPPNIFLHMGDMAYSTGTYTEFTDKFYAPYETVLRNTVSWPAMGNHEGASSNSDLQSGPYYDGYVLPDGGEAGGLASGTEAYYSFDHGNVHFIILDSHQSDRDPGAPMLTWTAADIAATDQDWVVAYWHHPPYTKGSHDSDAEGALIDMRENALPILEAGGVDLVLGGHSHIYERTFLLDGAYQTPSVAGQGVLDNNDGRLLGDGPYSKPQGLTSHNGAVYIVAGHGGTGVSQQGPHPLVYFAEVANGSCILDVQGNTLSVINIRWDGEITDRVAMIKGDGVMVAAPDGGESLGGGNVFPITWATVGAVANVRIEYSVSNGADWTEIEDSVPNTGTYDWVVPGVDTTQGLIRISDASDSGTKDESNGVFNIGAAAPVEVIGFGGDWLYHDQGVDLGAEWNTPGFDDSDWPEGPGQFGYGDGDEATLLVDAEPNYPSAYFRKTVTLEKEPTEGEITVLFDDGYALFVNGEQVHGVNVANGVDYAAFASTQSADNETVSAQIPIDAFVEGDNTVAVIAKNASGGSSDLSFDMSMVVYIPGDPPPPGGDTGDTGDSGDDGDGDSADGPDGDGTDSADSGQPTAGTASGGSSGGGSAGADAEGAGCGCGRPAAAFPFWAILLLLGIRRR